MNLKRMLLLSLILAMVSATMMSAVSAAQTWDVGNNTDSTSIQNIINNASDGDTISFFANGTYVDTSITINKNLTLNGNGATLSNPVTGAVILNIASTNNKTTSNVTINNFIIEGGRAIVANGVNNLIITNNIIDMYTNNDAISLTSVQVALLKDNEINGKILSTVAGRDAIGVVNSSDINIIDNNLSGFTRNGISMAAGRLGALNETSTFNILIKGNNIFNITEEGIYFGGGVSHVDIINNILSSIPGNAINIVRSSENILIKDNTITNCGVAIRIEEGNIFHDNETPTVLKNVTIKGNYISSNGIAILLVNVTNSANGLNITKNTLSNNDQDIVITTQGANAFDEQLDEPVTDEPDDKPTSWLKKIFGKIVSIITCVFKLIFI